MAFANLLPGILPAGAKMYVAIAFGADISQPTSSWVFYDYTSYVRVADGISIKTGRGDESDFGQPAQAVMSLDNSSGRFSLGAQSPLWPNVKKNVPVRIAIDAEGDGTYAPVFTGYADAWAPSWDQSGNLATVELTASGIFRRLQQNKSPVRSSLRRRLESSTNVIAYWPLEEGKGATDGKSFFARHPAMKTVGGAVEFGANTDIASTLRMPELKGGGLAANIPLAAVNAAGHQFRFLTVFPEAGTSGMVNDGVIVRLFTNNPDVFWVDLRWKTNGDLQMRKAAIVGRDLVVTDYALWTFQANGRKARMYVNLVKPGADLRLEFGLTDVDQSVSAQGAGILIAGYSGAMPAFTRVEFVPDNNLKGLCVGHAVAQNEVTSWSADLPELTAFYGEDSYTRFLRLADENKIERTFAYGPTTPDGYTPGGWANQALGQQLPQALMELLEEVQDVSLGVIYEGKSTGGLVFRDKTTIEAQTAKLTVNVGAGELAGLLQPIDDDQRLLNRATVTREGGWSATYEDTTGPLGTTSVGVYDAGVTVNAENDSTAIQLAGWMVAAGTIEGYRYPSIEINLAASPQLATAVNALVPGDRIDLTNVTGAVSQHPGGTIRLLMQGMEQYITPRTWRAVLTCTPYAPWNVGRMANTDGTPYTGKPDDQTLRLDTSTSQLSAAAAINATTLTVATSSGPLWTRNAQDLPLQIMVAGIVVTVTAISGAASPQTFTVTGVTKALPSGSTVTVHEPNTLGL